MNRESKLPVNIVLADIRSALNVGAIFRTCDATDIHKLYLTGITPYPPHNKIPKTALGSIETVSWERAIDSIELVKQQKSEGRKIISIEINDKSRNIYEFEFSFPTTLIFGNEISGVSEELLEMSDEIVHLPMFGSKESLNVATTVGITLYEIIRQYHFSK